MSMPHEAAPVASFESRCQRVLQFARDLYRQSPDWIRFFKEVVGVDGAARKVFTNQKEYIAFERSETFHTIQRMVNALRNNKATSNSSHEPTRVITVRLPESLHEALKAEANDHSTSMNKLCIAKLLQVLEEDEVSRQNKANTNTYPAATNQPAYNQQRYGQNASAGQQQAAYNKQMQQMPQRQNMAYNQQVQNRQIPQQNTSPGMTHTQQNHPTAARQNLNNPAPTQPSALPNQGQGFRATNQPLTNQPTTRPITANYQAGGHPQQPTANNQAGYNQPVQANPNQAQNPQQPKPQTPPYRPNQF